MIAMFLYPDSTIYEGGKEMLRILETGLPFRAEEYIKGLGISEISDNTGMLWDCLQKCRSHTPLPDREGAKCAAYAAVIGEILEAEGRISSKNSYLLNWKQAYPRRTAYHRELRNFGMKDGK